MRVTMPTAPSMQADFCHMAKPTAEILAHVPCLLMGFQNWVCVCCAQVLSLYRSAWRAASKKEESERPALHAFIRAEFEKNRGISHRNIMVCGCVHPAVSCATWCALLLCYTNPSDAPTVIMWHSMPYNGLLSLCLQLVEHMIRQGNKKLQLLSRPEVSKVQLK